MATSAYALSDFLETEFQNILRRLRRGYVLSLIFGYGSFACSPYIFVRILSRKVTGKLPLSSEKEEVNIISYQQRRLVVTNVFMATTTSAVNTLSKTNNALTTKTLY